ncbi:MAG: SHOCT domain-containing protein [Spirochaetales bacterium]|nr:SHOCT domain-containing protein [Spirochaetales bacterium]MCF7939318.1 SHOCT domain-containing protein [Spirochaetales bacterium]
MKRVALISLGLLLVAFFAWSLSGTHSDEHSAEPNQVIEEIRGKMELGPEETIDPDAVPVSMLEKLGEAVMSEIHPNERVHLWMDRMMGGEGSQSLASTHRWMGYRYLTDGSEYGYGRRGMGMMGPGMMGRSWGMHGSDYGPIPYDSPEEVLKQRYARGEISREEYLRALDDLKR